MTNLTTAALLAAVVLTACAGGDEATPPTTMVAQTAGPLPTLPPSMTSVAVPESTEPVVVSTTDAPNETPDETPVESSPTTIPDTTAPENATPSTAPATSVAPVDNTPVTTPAPVGGVEPDWVDVVQGLNNLYDELRMTVEPDRLLELCSGTATVCYSELGGQVRGLAAANQRVTGFLPTEIVSATVVGTLDDLPAAEAEIVILDVELIEPPNDNIRIVDADGNVVFEVDDYRPGEVIGERWTLRRTSDGWRLVEFEETS